MISVVEMEKLAVRAVILAKPSIEELQKHGIAKREHGCLLVAYAEDWGKQPSVRLATYTMGGEHGEWEHDYDVIATNKLNISCRTGYTTREVRENYPHLKVDGDVEWVGTALNEYYGLVVAFSGVDEHIDEVIAEIVLAILVGLVRDAEIKQQTAAAA